jgi:hypothetical protein
VDPEEIEDSSNPTIGSSSEMTTIVSLINYLLLSNVIKHDFGHTTFSMCVKEYEGSNSSAAASTVNTRTRKESLEQRLNIFINKHAENGIAVSSQCADDGCVHVVYSIACAFCQDISFPTSNNTWAANWEQHVRPNQANAQKGSKVNHYTQKQKFVNQSILSDKLWLYIFVSSSDFK